MKAEGDIDAQKDIKIDGNLFLNGDAKLYSKLTVWDIIRSKGGFVNESTSKFNGVTRFNNKVIFNDCNIRFNCFQNLTGNTVLGVNSNGKITLIDNISMSSGNFDFLNANRLKIGQNSLYLGSPTSGTTGISNYIYTDNGALSINDNIDGVGENTYLNKDGVGQVFIGTEQNEIADPLEQIYGGSINSNLFKLAVRNGLIVTGQNSIISFRGIDDPNNPSTYSHENGDAAICIENRPAGDPNYTTQTPAPPITGLNFFIPYGTGYNLQNWVLFYSTDGSNRGNVGIGTPYPKYKLSVEGVIGSREIIVETNDWGDYVFEKDYSLLSLQELKKYILNNNHLPNFENSKEMIENGIPLAEITKKQMVKIEELTLYVIQQNDDIILLSKENKELKDRLERIEKKLDQLTK